MKDKFLLCCLIFSFFGFSLNAQSNAPLSKIYKELGLSENISYTAEMVVDSPYAGMENMNFKMSYKNGNFRSEGSQSGMSFIMIMKQSGTMYTYNDAMKMWIKTEMQDVIGDKEIPEYKKIGDEELEGKKCTRFEAKDATGFSTIVWINDGMIYKSTNIDPAGKKQTVSYKNVLKQDLDDSLFSPPQDASVQDMSEMMKGLMQGKGQ